MLKHIAIRLLNFVQKTIDKEYEKNGLDNDILELQIRVNRLTNKYNINNDEEWKQ